MIHQGIVRHPEGNQMVIDLHMENVRIVCGSRILKIWLAIATPKAVRLGAVGNLTLQNCSHPLLFHIIVAIIE